MKIKCYDFDNGYSEIEIEHPEGVYKIRCQPIESLLMRKLIDIESKIDKLCKEVK